MNTQELEAKLSAVEKELQEYKEAMEWAFTTQNVSFGQSLDGTYSVWLAWLAGCADKISEGLSPMEAIQTARKVMGVKENKI